MSVKNARKIGFWSALSVSLGSVIGIGIFLKNGSIMRNIASGDGQVNFIALLIAWIVGALISLCAAYSFSEVATSRHSKSGLAGWIEALGGRKQGLFIKVLHCTVYYVLFIACLPTIAVEGLFQAIDTNNSVHIGYIFLCGVGLIIFIGLMNFFALKASGKMQFIGTITKLVPLVLAIVVGLIGANKTHILNNPAMIENPVNNVGVPVYATSTTSSFDVSSLFLALPSILFAFDSFLCVGNLATEMDKPEKKVPIVAVITIIAAAIVYILIAIGSGLTGLGSVGEILKTLTTNTQIQNDLAIAVNVFITVSAIIVINGMSMAFLKSCEGLVAAKHIMFYQFFQKLRIGKHEAGGFALYWILTIFYMLLLGIPSVVLNDDAVFDAATNAPVVIVFLIYAYACGLGIYDRYKQRNRCVHVKGFLVAASIAIILILVLFFEVTIYDNIVKVAMNPYGNSSDGLFYSTAGVWKNIDHTILFWAIFIWAAVLPTINYFVLKKDSEKTGNNKEFFVKYKFNWKEAFKKGDKNNNLPINLNNSVSVVPHPSVNKNQFKQVYVKKFRKPAKVLD
ncbi:MAG: amino acid permease [Malacoplasma sp.]|nr:amino acid permease [Malacoplasma sp.]